MGAGGEGKGPNFVVARVAWSLWWNHCCSMSKAKGSRPLSFTFSVNHRGAHSPDKEGEGDD